MGKETESKNRLARIAEMEAILDETARLNADLAGQLEALAAARKRMRKLFRYFGSRTWYRDRESGIPEDVRAGVLSEDLVYDEIVNLREASIRMLELATDVLKNVL